MKHLKGRTAVITGAASGFGLEASRIAAREGMNVVMADVQQDALDCAAHEVAAPGRGRCCRSGWTCRRRPRSRRWAPPRWQRFGAPGFVFNNAGVGAAG
jgi:NAD(P)-dependent dehydrogenase (short-subunit alcohol dehydrogenase family)